MTIQQFVLRLCPAHAELEKEVVALRGELALAEARLEMAQQRAEAVAVPVKPKPSVFRAPNWRAFQDKIADLQEKEQ